MTTKWLAVLGLGEGSPGVPAGKVIAGATEFGGRGPMRYFVLTPSEYVPRMEIHPSRHVELVGFNPLAARASGALAAEPDALGTALPWSDVIQKLEGRQ